jgi:hypothetical protein
MNNLIIINYNMFGRINKIYYLCIDNMSIGPGGRERGIT